MRAVIDAKRNCENCGVALVRKPTEAPARLARRRFCSRKCQASVPAIQERRFLAKVDKGDGTGCWLWMGGQGTLGYGLFTLYHRNMPAHRWSYEHFVGPIPAGLVIDHLCRTHACVRPDHLEPVTTRENVLRGISPAARYARATHCIRGHPFDEANTHRYKGGRICRECRRLAESARRREKVGVT